MGCSQSTVAASPTPKASTASPAATTTTVNGITTVKAYGATSTKTPIEPVTIQRRAPLENDVSIKILFCGVCHTDLHVTRGDWGENAHTVVPGHEIIGEVTAVGPNVSKFKVGEKVGVGCMVDSCHSCHACKRNVEQYCDNGFVGTYNADDKHMPGQKTHGGYSQTIIVREEFVLRIPSALDLAGAAPLLCAGITMYSPLAHWKVSKGSKVGIVGLGGLGHMGLKLAHAMGAEVSLFTRSKGKEAEAKAMGADKVIISTDKAQMDAVANYFDLIIDTVPAEHDVSPYVDCVDLDGTVVIVGFFGPTAEKLNTAPLIFKRKTVAGSIIGGVKETQDMLDFCGKHGIVSEIEKIAFKDINTAYGRMEKSDVRYRFVIDNSTL